MSVRETFPDPTSEKPSVLVTGGAGYIGSHAVLALRDAGWPVVIVDDLSTGFAFAVPGDVPFYRQDVGHEAAMEKILKRHRIRAVMHFAGSVVVPDSVSDPLGYYDNNTVKSRALIAAVVAAKVPHFIFSSTAATYGVPQGTLIAETTPQQPINPYGWSKFMTERMVIDTANAHAMNYCILRYFNVAGADPHGRAGQATRGATHLIKVAVEAALGKRDHVAIFGNDYDTPDGTGVRDYIHVSDLAAAHVLALEALIDAPERSHIFNCGYGRGFSVLEVLDAVERVTGRTVERRMQARRSGDAGSVVADSSRLKDALGWSPRHAELDTIVQHAVEWERSRTALSDRADDRNLVREA